MCEVVAVLHCGYTSCFAIKYPALMIDNTKAIVKLTVLLCQKPTVYKVGVIPAMGLLHVEKYRMICMQLV